jgi:DNA mismatch repair ATPase MutS
MPVFCEGGRASLLSAVCAHFPRDERFEGTGRFLDEKNRVDAMLKTLDGNALVLLNETFATTGEEKAIEQTGILADFLYKSGNFGLYITHQHGLTDLGIPYLNVLIDRSDANRRTYKIARQKSTGGSYAKDILTRLGLTEEALTERFGALSDREEANA